jgi:hypothetical protein
MSWAKLKDDLALLTTGLVFSAFAWIVFHFLGMYTFLIVIGMWMFVSIRYWRRTTKKGKLPLTEKERKANE